MPIILSVKRGAFESWNVQTPTEEYVINKLPKRDGGGYVVGYRFGTTLGGARTLADAKKFIERREE
jgi:hypothetical protein